MATANETKAAKAAKAEYTVISPLNHDQEDYAPGDTVSLTEAQAKPLLPHTVKALAADAAKK